jgi:hypothetical protein
MRLKRRTLLGGTLGYISVALLGRCMNDPNELIHFTTAKQDPSYRRSHTFQALDELAGEDNSNFPKVDPKSVHLLYLHGREDRVKLMTSLGVSPPETNFEGGQSKNEFFDGELTMATLPLFTEPAKTAERYDQPRTRQVKKGDLKAIMTVTDTAYDISHSQTDFKALFMHEYTHVMQFSNGNMYMNKDENLKDLASLNLGDGLPATEIGILRESLMTYVMEFDAGVAENDYRVAKGGSKRGVKNNILALGRDLQNFIRTGPNILDARTPEESVEYLEKIRKIMANKLAEYLPMVQE